MGRFPGNKKLQNLNHCLKREVSVSITRITTMVFFLNLGMNISVRKSMEMNYTSWNIWINTWNKNPTGTYHIMILNPHAFNMILDGTTSFKIWVVLCGQHVIWRPSTNGYVSSELGQRLGVGLGWVSIDHHWPIRGGHLGTQAFILVCWLLRALLCRACALQWHLRKKSSMVQMDQDARIFTELRR